MFILHTTFARGVTHMDLILREPWTFLVTEIPLQISVKYFTEKVTHKHTRAH